MLSVSRGYDDDSEGAGLGGNGDGKHSAVSLSHLHSGGNGRMLQGVLKRGAEDDGYYEEWSGSTRVRRNRG